MRFRNHHIFDLTSNVCTNNANRSLISLLFLAILFESSRKALFVKKSNTFPFHYAVIKVITIQSKQKLLYFLNNLVGI